MNSPFFGESKSKATPTQEIEIFLPPLSSQDLENLGDESEVMSQFQIFDSSLKDLDDPGIDASILENAKTVTASKNINERFKKKIETSEDHKSEEELDLVPLSDNLARKQNKMSNFLMETDKAINTDEKIESKGKIIGTMNSDAEIQNMSKLKRRRDSILGHPFRKLVFSEDIDPIAFKKFLALTYRGLNYCKKCLKSPSDRFILSKEVLLPEPRG